MVLEVIYVTRHGFRSNWVVDPETGTYNSTIRSPTGIAADPALASYGVDQARQLADHVVTLDPPVERVYSSPFYRCIETIDPSVRKLAEAGKGVGDIRGENGIGEWYGTARFDHPSPASPSVLHSFFPSYSLTYKPHIIPSSAGETIPGMHDRVAYALTQMIHELDSDPAGPKAVLLCTHAAPLIAIGRVLTGRMPDSVEAEDFRPFTCSLSKFVRRRPGGPVEAPGNDSVDAEKAAQVAKETIHWRDGNGVGGGWDCIINGDCSFLSGGEERGWRFSGDESFAPPKHPSEALGLDAGTELGVVVEGHKKGGRKGSGTDDTSDGSSSGSRL
ncbi:MAG: hypothetical protein M1819_001096 [Sarea resinae]|nr:MAG: hypothetical protein M1819_001096 [Sarea resinae]